MLASSILASTRPTRERPEEEQSSHPSRFRERTTYFVQAGISTSRLPFPGWTLFLDLHGVVLDLYRLASDLGVSVETKHTSLSLGVCWEFRFPFIEAYDPGEKLVFSGRTGFGPFFMGWTRTR